MVSSAFGTMVITQCCDILGGEVRARARARTSHKIKVFLVYHSWWLTFLHQTFTKSIGHHGSDITYTKFKQKLNMLAYRWLRTRARARAYTSYKICKPLHTPHLLTLQFSFYTYVSINHCCSIMTIDINCNTYYFTVVRVWVLEV